jgi:hypothetical protein
MIATVATTVGMIATVRSKSSHVSRVAVKIPMYPEVRYKTPHLSRGATQEFRWKPFSSAPTAPMEGRQLRATRFRLILTADSLSFNATRFSGNLWGT